MAELIEGVDLPRLVLAAVHGELADVVAEQGRSLRRGRRRGRSRVAGAGRRRGSPWHRASLAAASTAARSKVAAIPASSTMTRTRSSRGVRWHRWWKRGIVTPRSRCAPPAPGPPEPRVPPRQPPSRRLGRRGRPWPRWRSCRCRPDRSTPRRRDPAPRSPVPLGADRHRAALCRLRPPRRSRQGRIPRPACSPWVRRPMRPCSVSQQLPRRVGLLPANRRCRRPVERDELLVGQHACGHRIDRGPVVVGWEQRDDALTDLMAGEDPVDIGETPSDLFDERG